MSEASTKSTLREAPLFVDLTDEELDRLVPLCREVTYERGDVIFGEGGPVDSIYIVDSGRVAIEMELRPGSSIRRRATIETLDRAQTMAWSGVIGYPTMASGTCIDHVKAIAIDAEAFRRFLEEEPAIGLRVMRRLVMLVRSRLASVRDTLANILSIASHDLKAPLNAVESYHQVILGGYAGETTEQQRNMLRRSGERIRGLLGLIDDILDLSRLAPDAIDTEPLALEQVAEISLENVRPQATDKGIELVTDCPADLPLVEGNSVRLQQVFTNLVSNAVKFTQPGGRVTLGMRASADHVTVEVSDNGPGIPEDELPHIFDDFYRGTRGQGQGAGLGLSIARRIVEAHGGYVRAESPYPGSSTGTRFTFTLPTASGDAEQLAEE